LLYSNPIATPASFCLPACCSMRLCEAWRNAQGHNADTAGG
jgi:hypothetical protein